MSLSIIIGNYKSTQLVVDCLNSIYAQPQGEVETEIIVVDAGSNDNIEEILRTQFPTVRFIQMGYNSGFARLNNEGMRQAKGDVFLLINSDTIVENNAINLCYKDFVKSEYVACGLQLLNRDRTPQISGNYAMKGGLNYLLPLPFVGKFLKFLAESIKVKKPNIPEVKGVMEVDWVNGAFIMLKKSALDKAGLMDEEFFLYAEEAEWCGRIQKVGKLCIFGDYNIVHLQGESTGAVFESSAFNIFDKRGLQIVVSNFLRIRKQFGLGWYFFSLLMFFITIPVFFVGLLITKPFGKTEYTFGHWWSYTKNYFVLLSLADKMIFRKKHFYKML